jgi:hypothetical protein
MRDLTAIYQARHILPLRLRTESYPQGLKPFGLAAFGTAEAVTSRPEVLDSLQP